MRPNIPFNRPSFIGDELQYVADAVNSGHISGDGSYTKRCTKILENIHGAPKALLTTSCTHALEMAALLLDIQPGDEVIVPSFTFVSTVNAFVLRGAKPVFIDIRPDTLNLDETALESLISSRTRAIVPVHYAGVGCEMDQIMQIANRNSILVVEDNAHGFLGFYKKKPLGAFGTFSTLSFHETKNVTCGEGGALIINDPAFIQRAEIIREKGTNRSRFFRGEVDKYTWVDVGSSYLPSDILAAVLYAQLENRDKIQAKRALIWQYYFTHLAEWAEASQVSLPFVPRYTQQPYHMFYLLLPDPVTRNNFLTYLKSNGIHSVFHYLPLHQSEVGKKFGYLPGDIPVTVNISERLVRLPFFYSLTEEELNAIVSCIVEFDPSKQFIK